MNVPGTFLDDVVLVNDSLAYAVGQIYSRDSTGNVSPFASNMVDWNGSRWSLKKLYYFDGTVNSPIVPTWGIVVHGRHEVWLSSGSIFQWDVDSTIAKMVFSRFQFPNPNVVLMSLSSNGSLPVFAYGTHGQIVVWDGASWTIQQTGTGVDITDVWVDASGQSAWACGYASNYSESVLLRFDGKSWNIVWKTGLSSSPHPFKGLLQSLWSTDNQNLLIVGGDGVYRIRTDGGSPARIENVALGAYPHSVRGPAMNDLFVVGDGGMVWHYNGSTWHKFTELSHSLFTLLSVAFNGRTVIIVGADFNRGIQQGIIIMGKRN